MTKTAQTAVAGVTGYAGAELARLLLHHPRLKGAAPVFVGRMDEKDAERGGIPLAEIHPQLADNNGRGNLKLEPFSWELLADRGVKVLFLATPHEQSREWVPEALSKGLRIIDLSGAWRLKEAGNRAVYAFHDEGSKLAASTQGQAVYGMPELHRSQIAGARLVANPGCYATSVILAVRPLVAAGLVDLAHGIVADAKSGVSGGIVAVVPGQFGIGVFSPRLDRKGNSARGIKVFDELSQRFGLHIFEAGFAGRTLRDELGRS